MEETRIEKPVMCVCYLCGNLQLANGHGAGAAQSAWIEPDSPQARSIVGQMLKDEDSLRFSYTCCPDCLHHFQNPAEKMQWAKSL